MAAIKFVLLFALAFFACQGETKQVHHPLAQPSPKIFDIVGIIEKVIEIVEKIIAQVNAGVDEVDPILQELVALLPPNTGKDVTDLITTIRQLLQGLEVDITTLIDQINAAIASLDSIKECTDPQTDAFKEILDTALEGIDKVIRDTNAANQAGLDDIINGAKSDYASLKALIDDNIAAGLKCLTPGNADSCTCLTTVKDDIVNGVVALGANVVLHLTAIQDVFLNTVLPQIIDGATPIVNDGLAATKPLVDEACACVASMS